jgi:arsenite methyltransferase
METDMTTVTTFDPKELEAKVKAMYRSVAEDPKGDFHFEMGRAMAERLGYAPADLDRIPAESIESFAGVGYYFHLADLRVGETVVDLGSGSGMDTFIAALKVGPRGKVVGVDMTDEQRAKADRLRDRDGFPNVTLRERLHRGSAAGGWRRRRRDQQWRH